MIRVLLAIIALTIASSAQAATQCRTAPGKHGHYAYRYLDSRPDVKCWYRGERGLSKLKLEWRLAPNDRAQILGEPTIPLILAPILFVATVPPNLAPVPEQQAEWPDVIVVQDVALR